MCEAVQTRNRHDETGDVVAFDDHRPSAPRHTLVVPRRHVARLVDLDVGEYTNLWLLARRQLLRLGADGYTVGVNDGPLAGQTIPHAHLHVIPRAEGDTADPKFGIRRAIPETAVYR